MSCDRVGPPRVRVVAPLSPGRISDPVAEELDRIAHAWQLLSPQPAKESSLLVHAVCATLTGSTVPDLGPSALMDQLVVVTYDAEAARSANVLAELVALRRCLSDNSAARPRQRPGQRPQAN